MDLLNASATSCADVSKHTHEGYAVGVVESGALGFAYRGESLVAGPGTVNLGVPGEPHTGFTTSEEGWTYRMFYLDAKLMEHVASQVADQKRSRPFSARGSFMTDAWPRHWERLTVQWKTSRGISWKKSHASL